MPWRWFTLWRIVELAADVTGDNDDNKIKLYIGRRDEHRTISLCDRGPVRVGPPGFGSRRSRRRRHGDAARARGGRPASLRARVSVVRASGPVRFPVDISPRRPVVSFRNLNGFFFVFYIFLVLSYRQYYQFRVFSRTATVLISRRWRVPRTVFFRYPARNRDYY